MSSTAFVIRKLNHNNPLQDQDAKFKVLLEPEKI